MLNPFSRETACQELELNQKKEITRISPTINSRCDASIFNISFLKNFKKYLEPNFFQKLNKRAKCYCSFQ